MVAEKVLQELKTDSVAATIASEVVQADTHTETSLFNTRLAQISLIKTRQLHDYLKVCSIRLQTDDKLDTPSSQKRAEDQLCILKALLAV